MRAGTRYYYQLLSLPTLWQVQLNTFPPQPGSSLCLPICEKQWTAEMSPITKSQIPTAASTVAKQENIEVLSDPLPVQGDD